MGEAEATTRHCLAAGVGRLRMMRDSDKATLTSTTGDTIMTAGHSFIFRTTECARQWREPRWHPQMLPSPRTWLRSALPGIVPAAVIVGAVAPLRPAHGP